MAQTPLLPLDIAREALRRLAMKRVPPTPGNYRAFYHEIAGTQEEDEFPERSLKQIAASLPRDSAERLRLVHQFEHAIEAQQWETLKHALLAIYDAPPTNQPAWAPLLRDLIAQTEMHHNGLTPGQKREALNRVLASTATNPELLFTRLQGLLRGWHRSHAEKGATTRSSPPAAPRETSGRTDPEADLPGAPSAPITHLLAQLLRKGVVPLVADNLTLVDEAIGLADLVEGREPDPRDGEQIKARFDALGNKLEWAGEDQRAVRLALLNLLRLIVRNISELIVDDNWLRGQIEILNDVFNRPLDLRVLDEVERRLRDVIDKQGHLKRQLTDVQEHLKNLLLGFVDRLAGFAASTGHYHDTLTRCAEVISNATDISELATVVDDVLQETRTVQETAKRSGEELTALREQVESANHHIARLQRELDETSEMVRHDPLTGVLNRKGLDEALVREISRARRRSATLCVAVVDVDNFKQLNDTFGHRVGDEALRHLADVMRESLRPQDLVGRLGGEEFLILLPDTDAEHSMAIVSRLQRELTKRFFLAENQRLLITFSAGVACLGEDEPPQEATDRADKAMYAAKKAGKNRVFLAP